MKPKVKPTGKQRTFVGHLVANPDSTLAEAARAADYPESTARNARRDILEGKGTLSVIEEFGVTASQTLNNEFILNAIKEMIEAEKIDHSHTEPDRVIPDWDARDKGLKHAFNARGLNQTVGNQTNVQFNLGELKGNYSK